MPSLTTLAGLYFALLSPNDAVLDGHLTRWEQAMARAASYSAKFEMTRTDAIFGRERKFSGTILLMKPKFYRIHVQSNSDRNQTEDYLFNGKSLFVVNQSKKIVTEIPSEFPGFKSFSHTPVLDLFRDLKKDTVKKRYQIRQIKKDDKNYIYLDIKPLLATDAQNYVQLQLALYGPDVKSPLIPYLPALIRILQPNGDADEYRFTEQVLNVKVNGKPIGPRDFLFEEPKGEKWTIRKARSWNNITKP